MKTTFKASWGPWERVDGEGRGRERGQEKCKAQQKSINKKKKRKLMGTEAFIHFEETPMDLFTC